MGIKLTAHIPFSNVELREVSPPLYLVVQGSADKVHGSQCAVRDNTGIVTWLNTPGYLLCLCVADGLACFRGREEAAGR